MKWRLADCHYFCFDVSKGSQSFLSVRTRPLLLFLVFFFISIFKQGWVSTSPRTEIFDFRSVFILFFLSLFFFKWRSKRTAQRQGPRYPTADVTILRFLRSRGRKLWLIAKTRQDTKKKEKKKKCLATVTWRLGDTAPPLIPAAVSVLNVSDKKKRGEKRSLESSLSTTFGGMIIKKKKEDRKGSCERGARLSFHDRVAGFCDSRPLVVHVINHNTTDCSHD